MSATDARPPSGIGADAGVERALRIRLAGAHRVFALLGWTELINNHITVRVPGTQSHFLINPFGMHDTEVIPQAFARLWALNRACEIQLATAALGPARMIGDEIAARCTRDSLQFDPRHGTGDDVLNALLWQVDGIDSSYRD